MTPERLKLIRRIEELRGSSVICYLTSLRPNVPARIAQDQVRVIFDHLLLLPSRPVEKLDLFLVSNGGDSVVPWRLVALFREFAKTFSVLIPYRAYSAATLMTLGADEIVMHPFGELGPIDPTVSTDFNPREDKTDRVLGISVEDVKAYISFIKNTVGITHEDELVKTIEVLANKVHPLALGNVERFVAQSRMMAKKILKTHMNSTSDHEIHEIVENLASKLYFHGHPINRQEAKQDLGLKVNLEVQPELETLMWDLYKSFEDEFQNAVIFDPVVELQALGSQPPNPQGPNPPKTKEFELLHASVESARYESRYATRRRATLVQIQLGQKVLVDEVLSQGWTHSSVAAEPIADQPSSSS
jgi:hypothetical protein